MLQLMNPVAEPIVRPAQLAPRLRSLDGKTIGLFANLKLNSVELMDLVGAELGRRHRDLSFVRGSYNAGRVMYDHEWKGVDDCDVIILTHGD